MKVEKIVNLSVEYYKVYDELNNEGDVFEYFRNLGYRVFSDYAFYFRKADKFKQNNRKLKRQELIDLSPKFNSTVHKLFKKFKSGEPDLLIEKDGVWEFVEVKTTNDSLRANQIVFLEELSKIHKTKICYFIFVGTIESQLNKGRKHLVQEKKPVKKTNFEVTLAKLSKTQKVKGYSAYWVLSKLFLEYLSLCVTPDKMNLITHYTTLSGKTIKWYISSNGVKIIKNEHSKLMNKKTLSRRDITLLKKYKDYLKI